MSNPRTTATGVEPLPGRWVRVSYADGAVHEVDLTRLLAAGGAFAVIRDDDDVFRGDRAPASGTPLPRRVIQAA